MIIPFLVKIIALLLSSFLISIELTISLFIAILILFLPFLIIAGIVQFIGFLEEKREELMSSNNNDYE